MNLYQILFLTCQSYNTKVAVPQIVLENSLLFIQCAH